jgi:hypothetical protein
MDEDSDNTVNTQHPMRIQVTLNQYILNIEVNRLEQQNTITITDHDATSLMVESP